MKSFDVPIHYRSPLITAIKKYRKEADKLKKDFSPTEIVLSDNISFLLARHFGFCYGVENAIEIAFRAVKENPGKQIYLLSEMIHNPHVNEDLLSQGVKFIMDTNGNQIISWDDVKDEDIVIIPAFGTTVEIESQLKNKNIEPHKYNTTCPFVEKVWNRSEKIGLEGFTVIVHGKPNHEETRATFSRSQTHTATVVVRDMAQTIELGKYILGEYPPENFYQQFKGQYSEGFDVTKHLKKIGVVNQTTMLATDTKDIAEYLKQIMIKKYHLNPLTIKTRFADTRDTLCYATNDNQSAVQGMLDQTADVAIVIGGYNSSNTSHLVELFERKIPTFYINDEQCLKDDLSIEHYDFHKKEILHTSNFLDTEKPLKILLTSGASCPDALVENVLYRLAKLLGREKELNEFAESFIGH